MGQWTCGGQCRQAQEAVHWNLLKCVHARNASRAVPRTLEPCVNAAVPAHPPNHSTHVIKSNDDLSQSPRLRFSFLSLFACPSPPFPFPLCLFSFLR